jgi:hypothetical protein
VKTRRQKNIMKKERKHFHLVDAFFCFTCDTFNEKERLVQRESRAIEVEIKEDDDDNNGRETFIVRCQGE